MGNDYRPKVDIASIAEDFDDLKIKIDMPEGAPNVPAREDDGAHHCSLPPLAAEQGGRGSRTAARREFLADGGHGAFESGETIAAPSSPYVLQAGAVIPAALITGIRSDLPGTISAQVTQNVYDSPTGRTLLVPQGARLIGEYDSEIGAGQSRAFLPGTGFSCLRALYPARPSTGRWCRRDGGT